MKLFFDNELLLIWTYEKMHFMSICTNGSLGKNYFNQGHWKSLRARSCNCVLASYLSDFIHKITVLWAGTNFMCNITYIKFPYRICGKMYLTKIKLFTVTKAVQCDLCELWVHIKCNNLNYLDYRYQNSNKSWYCMECCSTIFIFNSLLSNKNFLLLYEHWQ